MPAHPSTTLEFAEAIDALGQKHLLRPNKRLDHALANSAAQGVPDIAVSPLAGQHLAIQCELIGAKHVLEIGALGGYSTVWMAETGAKVTSLEINPHHRAVAVENTRGLDVEVILGAALDTLPRLAAEGRKFDFVFIDGDWSQQWEYFDWAVKLTRKKGCIYVDNVIRQLVRDDPRIEGRDSVVKKIGKDERVKVTMLTYVATHRSLDDAMFDGVLLAIVK